MQKNGGPAIFWYCNWERVPFGLFLIWFKAGSFQIQKKLRLNPFSLFVDSKVQNHTWNAGRPITLALRECNTCAQAPTALIFHQQKIRLIFKI